MLRLTSDDSGASQLIGYVYTALISVLILSSMMLTSSTMLNGSVSNTAQEEAEQLALYFQLVDVAFFACFCVLRTTGSLPQRDVDRTRTCHCARASLAIMSIGGDDCPLIRS